MEIGPAVLYVAIAANAVAAARQSSTSRNDAVRGASWAVLTVTISSGRSTGRPRHTIALTIGKIVVVEAIPTARVMTATSVTRRSLERSRKAIRASSTMPDTPEFNRSWAFPSRWGAGGDGNIT
jgi:hypothetical protein